MLQRASWLSVAVVGLLTGSSVAGELVASGGADSPLPGLQLVDVAVERGVALRDLSGDRVKDYIIDASGNGAAFLDFDRDGDLDLLVINGSTRDRLRRGGDPMAYLYRNDGGGRFVDVSARAGLERRGWAMGTCVADIDNDGDADVSITAFGANVLLRNAGDGSFEDISEAAGIGDERWGTSCAFGDYDGDGLVDLYVVNYVAFSEEKIPRRASRPRCEYYGFDVFCGPRQLVAEQDVLFHNEGDGRFADVTAAAGIDLPGRYGYGVVFSDVDDDGWPDILVANDSQENYFFRNRGDGTFEEMGLVAGVALSENAAPQAGMGIDTGDFDNDGDLDVFVTNFSHDYNTLYRNLGAGLFNDVTFPANLAGPSIMTLGWGTRFTDFDNDGLLDLFVANGHIYHDVDSFGLGLAYRQPNQLYRNLGDGRFVELGGRIGGGLAVLRSSRGAAFGDYDNDGDVDIFIVNIDDLPTFLENRGGNTRAFLGVDLEGAEGNRDAIGARLRLEVAGEVRIEEVQSGEGYLSQSDHRVHFGLGDAAGADALEVRWPSGRTQRFTHLPANRYYRIRESLGAPPG